MSDPLILACRWIEMHTYACPAEYGYDGIDCENECHDKYAECWYRYFLHGAHGVKRDRTVEDVLDGYRRELATAWRYTPDDGLVDVEDEITARYADELRGMMG